MSKTLEFSVVVPTYKRPELLARLLSSLTLLNFDPELFEVIVVDDGGDYPLDDTVSGFKDKLAIRLAKQENLGPAAARNRGSSMSRGKYLAFIDDDCQAGLTWLQAMKVQLEKTPNCACGGKVVNALPKNPYSAATQLLLDYLYENYNPLIHFAGFFPTANLTVPREIFLEIGGFDPTLRYGEDRDFCHRWSTLGYPFVSVPGSVVYHYHALNLGSLLSLHFSYGGGSFQFWRKHNSGIFRITALNSLSWHLKLMLSGIKKQRSAVGLLYAALLLIIQGACTAGLFWEWHRHRNYPLKSFDI